MKYIEYMEFGRRRPVGEFTDPVGVALDHKWQETKESEDKEMITKNTLTKDELLDLFKAQLEQAEEKVRWLIRQTIEVPTLSEDLKLTRSDFLSIYKSLSPAERAEKAAELYKERAKEFKALKKKIKKLNNQIDYMEAEILLEEE